MQATMSQQRKLSFSAFWSLARLASRALLGSLALLGLGLAATPADAVTLFPKSQYTSFSVATCQTQAATPDGQSYMCPGLGDALVYYAESNGRAFLAAGPTPQTTKAAGQTLSELNTPFRSPRARATIEWRFVIKNKRPTPYAMIVRHHTRTSKGQGQILVVTKVNGTESCQVARIDALAHPQAIVLARKIADGRGRNAPCPNEPTVEIDE
jgi:hypothetical protein